MSKRIVVIGSGFAGLTAAGLLAKAGHQVTVLEKNDQPGGRARVWQHEGFTFDMGPSWYWMPEVFEAYYNTFGHTASDFYTLERLDPSYRIYFPGNRQMDVPADMETLCNMFEDREPGSGVRLKQFLQQAGYKYKVAMTDYVHKLSDSITEYMDVRLLIKSFRLQLFRSLRSEVRQQFTNPDLVSLLEFPVLFLGGTPANIPSLYSMMNYADLVLGTWYPQGGMHGIVKAMVTIAHEQGVTIKLNSEVIRIEVENGHATRVHTRDDVLDADVVVAGSDYHHTEQQLLEPQHRRYDAAYWQQRTMSPSALLFYIGVNKKLPGLLHHNLFFDEDFERHAGEIYTHPGWPEKPLFYVCAPSITDDTVAPAGCENLFVLVPLAAGLHDDDAERETCYNKVMQRLEQHIGTDIRSHIAVKRSYAMNDFKNDYHAYKGNAYGLANTLRQTAVLKPKMRSRKVKNLFYTGQLTVPGPGVPPAIISGRMASREILTMFDQGKL